jgi:hypothetical protein
MRKDMNLLRKVGLLTLLMVIGVSAVLPAFGAENEKMITVQSLVARIKSFPLDPSSQRDRLTEELYRFVVSMDKADRDSFDPNVVDEIASLLSIGSGDVRSKAAITLGAIGPPALRSVGALLKALRQANDYGQGKHIDYPDQVSLDAALRALGVCVNQPGVTKLEEMCDYLLR